MIPPSRSARAVYGIAVAAELSGIGERTLRLYERKGLLAPHRTEGGTRRYSDDDIILLARIAKLLAEGINLTGARRVLELEAANLLLEAELAELSDRAAKRN